MECKHFSHTHGLIPHQVPQSSQISCSGCKSPGTGSIYACWACNYFLHEQCFHATRSMTHPSHSPHPLTLVPYPTYPSSSFYCNSCSLIGSGFSYSCSDCEFDLHVHCAYMVKTTHEPYPSNPNITYSTTHETIPQNNPPLGYPPSNYETLPHYNANIGGTGLTAEAWPYGQNIQHMNQPMQIAYKKEDHTARMKSVKHFGHGHPLLISHIKEEDSIICSCCEEVVLGTTYSCTKSDCDFYLHESCFGLAREIQHESHLQHPLTLLSSPAYKQHNSYECNACFNMGTCFVYHCKICQFDLHTSCASIPKTKKRQDHEHPLVLMYSSPYKKMEKEENQLIFSCDACNKAVDDRCWVYYCPKCDFGTHLDCSRAKTCSEEGMSLEMYAKISEIEARGRKYILESI